MKIETDEKWLFAKDLKPEGSMFEITDAKEVTSKKGTIIPTIVLLGSNGVRAGDFRVSTWNIENLKELILKWGSDSETWKGYKVIVKPVGEKVRFEVC